jgi:hypothetical protein
MKGDGLSYPVSEAAWKQSDIVLSDAPSPVSVTAEGLLDRDNQLWPPEAYFAEYQPRHQDYDGSSTDGEQDVQQEYDSDDVPLRSRVRRGSEGMEVRFITPADRERMVQEVMQQEEGMLDDEYPLEEHQHHEKGI